MGAHPIAKRDGTRAGVVLVGYARVSSETQHEQGQGLAIQRDSIRAYAEKEGLPLLRIYEDPAVSGASDIHLRPGLSQLIADARAHQFTRVVCSKLDRIARDTFLTLFICKELKKCDVELYSIAEPYAWDEPGQRMFLQLVSAFAEWERHRVVDRMVSGRKKKASLGRFPGSRTAYGYKSVRAELTINEAEAEIVRRIHRMKMGRKSLSEIARILNAESIKPRLGKKWWASSVRYILKNRLYDGELSCGTIKQRGVHPRIK